jgi:alkylation response protein AidB-like acyl-CoA dehydrogenase
LAVAVVPEESLAIQVHGGYGYTKEFDVEQGYRDNRLNAIHEGTHGNLGLTTGRKVVAGRRGPEPADRADQPDHR